MRMRFLPALLRCGGILALVLTMAACHSVRADPSNPPRGKTYALLLNGGGRPSINFQSHLTHIKDLVRLLEDYRIPRERIFIFSGDGDDPAADLATRDTFDHPDFWLLTRRAQQALRPQIEYVDSVVDGYHLQPATNDALTIWFLEARRFLEPGDTLLFYVTDHGEINKEDLTDNTIVLWKEDIRVSALREFFDLLSPEVRVVMLMSQCFSGSFAGLANAERNVCGYFASSADRPAYGCYPENRGVDGVGHSHHFLRGIELLGTLDEAHRHVLVADDSPDVPHTSSDVFLRGLLERQANEKELAEAVDERLDAAWRDRSRWEADIRLLDRIGQTYGMFSPRSLKELEKQIALLPQVSEQLSTYAERWQEALDAVRQANLDDFLAAHADWKERLATDKLKALKPAERTELAQQLLLDLAPFTRASGRLPRMETLQRRAEDAAAAAYRMEVRLGVVLRMHNLLTNIAGRVEIEESGSEAARTEYEALRRCENLELARVATKRPWWKVGGRKAHRADDLDSPEPFPRLDDDQRLVAQVMPAWMGIRYRPPTQEERDAGGRKPGAVTVMTVFPESAAGKAGLAVGDVILGPPGEPFAEPNQVREWTMQLEIGEPAPLRVQRGGEVLDLTLLPDPYPMEMPRLPGPPKVGSTAPALDLVPYRGDVTVRTGRGALLFFWATWCAPCKFALPEVMRLGRQHNVPVIAITDENSEALDRFFASFKEPFPQRVAIDPYRQAFQAYGVSGTPTFVLIDGDGLVQYYETGFNAEIGLKLP